MKHVSILVPQGTISVVNVAGSYQMLSWVNEFLQQSGSKPLFDIHLVAMDDRDGTHKGLFSVHHNQTIAEVQRTDLIIIPAIHESYLQSLEDNQPFIPWLLDRYEEGSEIASLCISSFFLASTGLLDGKPCSTHWQSAPMFRELFPNVILTDERIVTDSGGIYTSGGAYAFTNLIIYLIEKFAGRELAILAAKGFMIDIDRNSQTPFMIFKGQKSHQDISILKAQEIIEQNYTDKISVEDLSNAVALNRRTFERRFKKATSNTVLEYHQRVKIEAAKKEFEKGFKTVNEVMYDAGYTDPKAFREVFKKYTEMTPFDYMVKYKREAFSA